MNPKLKLGALVVVVLGVVTVLLLQQAKIKRLRAENADLRSQLSQLVSSQDTNEVAETQLKTAVETSEADHRELLRLRGQAARLRQAEQENIQLKAQSQQLERQAFESQAASEGYALAPRIAARIQAVKTAIVDYYANHGSLPDVTNFIEPTLIGEGLLEESMPYAANVRTRVMKTSDPIAPVTGANQAYSLDGYGTNSVFGQFVVEAVVDNVTAKVARELSLAIDGEPMTSPIGEADLMGRVKFGAIPSNGGGEVHVYLTHR